MGNSGKSRFHQLEYDSKMRFLETHSHTSERLGYEARKNRGKVIEGKRRRYDEANHCQKPPADRQRGGDGGGRRKATKRKRMRHDKGHQRQNSPAMAMYVYIVPSIHTSRTQQV